MKSSFILVLFSLSAFWRCEAAKGKLQTLFRLDHFQNCPNMKGVPVYFNESGVSPWGKSSAGYGTVIVDRTLTDFNKCVVTINRCKHPADTTCELFQTWRFNSNVCGLILMKGVIWSPLFTYKPQVACPLQKGVYKIENATLDTAKLALIKFPTDGYWRITAEVNDFIPKRIYCLFFAGKFVRTRG